MRKHLIVLLVMLSLVACNQKKVATGNEYDVIVIGGGPAGIGAALAAAETGARTALIERDSIIGGTTVQAEVCDMGLFYAWKRQIIAGPAWDLVVKAVETAHGSLPDFSKQEPDKWMESCVHVDPEVYYWMVDEHNAANSSARLVFLEKDKVATVPLRAMLPKGVGNMLVAGRAVSSDQGANSALRVQASCMAMGQAAGVVAALAAELCCDPREVPLDLIRKRLSDIGHIVPTTSSSAAPHNHQSDATLRGY